LAEIYAWKGEDAKAIEWFRYALSADPTDAQTRIRLARILFWSGHPEEAISEYIRALGEST
jgi:tetratricopeptide (TPR) repeat protein